MAAPLYRKTRQTDADLKEIYRYTRRTWGQAQAVRYLRTLEQRFRVLAKNPRSGRERTELQPPGLRSVTQDSHVIFYQPQPYGVLIVRVLHGRLDVAAQLGAGTRP